MKLHTSALLVTSLLAFASVLHAQDVATANVGTSHPEELNDTISTVPATAHYVKPSPAVAAEPATPLPAEPAAAVPGSVAVEEIKTPETPQLVVRPAEPVTGEVSANVPAAREDVDGEIVDEVRAAENQLPQGTLLHVALQNDLSTTSSVRGDAFQARLTQAIERHGRVALPEGSIISGRIADVEAGHHFQAPPSILLQPEFVTLPGGITYRMDARVVDLAHMHDVHVSTEGAIINSPVRGEVAGIGLTTAGAAVVGALVAGPVGAVIGGAIGAGVGTAVVLREPDTETLPEDTKIVLILNGPMTMEPVTRPRTTAAAAVSLTQHLSQ